MRRIAEADAVAFMKSRGLEPLEPYRNSTANWLCRCTRCGTDTRPRLGDLKTGKSKSGCRVCGGNNPLDPAIADSLLRAAGFTPLEPFKGVDHRWRATCSACGKESFPSITSIRRGHGCGWCAQQFPDLDKILSKMKQKLLEPLEPYPGGKINWKCRCLTCQRIVYPRYNNVDQGWGGCGICAGTRVDPADAAETMKRAGLEPLIDYPGNQKPWDCTHLACGKRVRPTYNSILFGQGGCKYCSVSGLKWGYPTILYVVANQDFHKVGVANNSTIKKRLTMHAKHDLIPIFELQFATGDSAYEAEQQIVNWWRTDCSAEPIPRHMLPDGWTETAWNIQNSPAQTLQYIRNRYGSESS